MKYADKIKMLYERLSSVYCDTCRFNPFDDGTCAYCLKGEMGWGISLKEAEAIVNELEYINEKES